MLPGMGGADGNLMAAMDQYGAYGDEGDDYDDEADDGDHGELDDPALEAI